MIAGGPSAPRSFGNPKMSLNISAVHNRDDPNELDIYKSSRHLRNGSHRTAAANANEGTNFQGSPRLLKS